MKENLRNKDILLSSFRDPSGFLFYEEGEIYRQVNIAYQEHYDYLMNSNLYDLLVKEQLLIPHEEVELDKAKSQNTYKVVKPEFLPFISYPYEWCFSELKDAALATLKILKLSLEKGMCLKDSSAYNIQFKSGKPILIDTLSFEIHKENSPWFGYKQFCQHFLAPLALMSAKDIRLNQLLRNYIDGIPLDLASTILPFRSKLNLGILTHVFLHSRSQIRYADKAIKNQNHQMSHLSFLGLIDNLESTVKGLKWKMEDTEWGEYYDNTNYTDDAFLNKKDIVSGFIDTICPKNIWDLGGNIGTFSRIASDRGIQTICFDIDPVAVEKNYRQSKFNNEKNILPLLFDCINPSPSIGWNNQERLSLSERGPVDMAMALALIHHLAISNNVPLIKIANFFAGFCKALIIEFVPKEDSQVQRLLSTREDIFTEYSKEYFEASFADRFEIKGSQLIKNSERTLYLMVNKNLS